MRILSMAILCVLILPACKGKRRAVNCARYRNGHFRYHLKFKGNEFDYFFERKDSIQIETDRKTGDEKTLGIEWTDSCEYQMRFINSKRWLPDSTLAKARAMKVRVEIVGGTEDYYLFRNPDYKDFTDTIWVDRKESESIPTGL